MCNNISVERTVEILIKNAVINDCKKNYDVDVLEKIQKVSNQLSEANFNVVKTMTDKGKVYIGETIENIRVNADYVRVIDGNEIIYDINYVLINDGTPTRDVNTTKITLTRE